MIDVSVQQIRETRPGACELKFLLDHDLAVRVARWARAQLQPDPHGSGAFGDQYRTTSLYFDTEAHDVLHGRRSFGRCKYRVRRYGSSEVVFLERKLRRPGLLHKRRTVTGLDELDRLKGLEPDEDWAGGWFHRRLLARRLKPACELSYVRLARVFAVNGSVARFTIDEAIHVRPATELGFSDGPAASVANRHMVLEMKFRGGMPAIFKTAVEQFALRPTTLSKYRLGMAALGHRAPCVQGAASPQLNEQTT